VEGWGTFAIASFEEQEVVPTLLQTSKSRIVEPFASDGTRQESCWSLKSAERVKDFIVFSNEQMAFTVSKRPRFEWVEVEKVDIVVDKFEPEKELEPVKPPQQAAPVMKLPNVYIGNIDDSAKRDQKEFRAKLVRIGDEQGIGGLLLA